VPQLQPADRCSIPECLDRISSRLDLHSNLKIDETIRRFTRHGIEPNSHQCNASVCVCGGIDVDDLLALQSAPDP